MVALVAAVAIAACGGDGAGDEGEPVDGDWLVDELTVAGERIELDPSWPITLTVDADRISGTAGCNRYTGCDRHLDRRGARPLRGLGSVVDRDGV
jgi:heat shock protein HslJ